MFIDADKASSAEFMGFAVSTVSTTRESLHRNEAILRFFTAGAQINRLFMFICFLHDDKSRSLKTSFLVLQTREKSKAETAKNTRGS